MKVLHISTSDQGGAANACLRLHLGLIQQNINSSVLVRQFNGHQKLPDLYKYDCSFYEKVRIKADSLLEEYKLWPLKSFNKNVFKRERTQGLEIFSGPVSYYDLTRDIHYKQADLINLHLVAYFLDYPSFFKKNKKPVVWTLHDMNPFTGGEHYLEWYSGINPDGTLLNRDITLKERTIFKSNILIKQKALQGVNNLHLVSPSNWLADEARKSTIFRNTPISVIPNSVDTGIFRIRNQKYSRELFGLPGDKIILLFVAENIYSQRKGLKILLEAFKFIENKNVFLAAIGQKGSFPISGSQIIDIGRISDEKLMSVIYSAADAFIIPSLMDNLPNTVLESLSCGTPVIGFPVGGIIDMVKNGINGLLCEDVSVDSLVATINLFLNDSYKFKRTEISKEARQKYALHVQAESYLKLYKEFLNQ